jgi:lysyl-tRNA synthetase class 1
MKYKKQEEELFWADQLANTVITRRKYHYLDKEIPKFKEYTVKTSASLSGVLHIGRLSDTIRGASVLKALQDAGVKARIIWVAEDMDPLRKVPKGVPAEYEKYIGMPVTDIPDPHDCHKSYAEHHKEEYLKVIDEFVPVNLEKYSMREEYKKGHFNSFVKKLLKSIKEVTEIQNKYRTIKLKNDWSPWKPICENCGKIVTTRAKILEDGTIKYSCKDYFFEQTTAKGCGHRGENDPLKGKGKLMWKSEWAAQWARWDVVSEGAGKEYQVPNSAFWINGEIVERILDFPMPVPIFYEHIMVDNVKMSASLGNVIYPKDWLEVAPPELLRFFYNKRLMKTRSFSWKDLPNIYDEYDLYGRVYLNKIKLENKKEEKHMKRLYEISQGNDAVKPIDMSFSHAAIVAQIFQKDEDIVESLKKTGHYNKEYHEQIFDRIKKAKAWLEKHAPDDAKLTIQTEVPVGVELNSKQKRALHLVAESLRQNEYDEKSLHEEFYNVCKKVDITPNEFFRGGYLVLLNRERGPKLAHFILTLGKEKVAELFGKV